MCLAEAVPTEDSRCNDVCCLCATEGAPCPDRLTHCLCRKHAIPAIPGDITALTCLIWWVLVCILIGTCSGRQYQKGILLAAFVISHLIMIVITTVCPVITL